MASRAKRDMTVEEFDACVRHQKAEEVREMARRKGPRVTLIRSRSAFASTFCPTKVSLPALAPPGTVPFTPQPSRKTGGWSAARQRLYIGALAETG